MVAHAQELETAHVQQHVVLVSHGDTLSILQATYHGVPLSQHRRYGLGTAELRRLVPEAAAEQAAAPPELPALVPA